MPEYSVRLSTITSLVWMWSSMNGTPVFFPSARSTETRAKLRRAGRRTFFVPSDRCSDSSCSSYQLVIKRTRKIERLACCMETNSASMDTIVPGRGSSSKLSGSCLIRALSRFLGLRSVSIWYDSIRQYIAMLMSLLRIDTSSSRGSLLKSILSRTSTLS